MLLFSLQPETKMMFLFSKDFSGYIRSEIYILCLVFFFLGTTFMVQHVGNSFIGFFLAGCGKESNLICFPFKSTFEAFFRAKFAENSFDAGKQQPCFKIQPKISFLEAIENPNKSLERKTFFKIRSRRCVPKLFPFRSS